MRCMRSYRAVEFRTFDSFEDNEEQFVTARIMQAEGFAFETLTTDGNTEFLGLGRVWIGRTLVRSGRLPLRPYTQTFAGLELAGLKLLRVRGGRIELEAQFRPMPVKVMRDHSFDPIHEIGDWGQDAVAGVGRLDLVIEPARDEFNGVPFTGFAYHWEYRSQDVPLYWLMDQASWELGGDITGATAVSQSSCSAPVATFDRTNAWSTEGILFFLVEQGNQNPVMTHNLPRWASHGAFDFQYKGDTTLIGVFERVELIRSVICRDAGKPELKHFDKHIFDQALSVRTSPKKILLNTNPKTGTAQQNLWTWIHEDVEHRARAEFGLKQEPFVPILSQNFWLNFTADSYLKDLIPAAAAIGCRTVFVDNLKKSAMTDRTPFPGTFNWNMCCGHEYQIAPELGGVAGVKRLAAQAKALGITVRSWTNNDQALSSPLNDSERDSKGWFVLLEDTRQKYGGAYAGVMSVLDFGVDAARDYFVKSHRAIARQTGLNWFFFDSFYNVGFMPVTYRDGRPRTMWRGTLRALKQLQDAGVHFAVETFGPFGCPQHGHVSSYNFSTLFACYRVGLGNDYSTVPTGAALQDVTPKSAAGVYYALAHMACGSIPLFEDGKRIDQVWTAAHKQALADYHAVLPHLHRRILQEDGLGVLWHDKAGRHSTLFNFKARTLALSGHVVDITTGRVLPRSGHYGLEANHTYAIRRPA